MDLFRLRDLLLASLGLLLLWPWLLLIAGLLALTQERVWFRQLRPGYQEKPFWLIKFSTMRDARPGEAEAAHQQARLTPVGRYLRRYSLDELPQLINVLRGEMSLVGPRPLLMDYLPRYTDAEHRRHAVPPGLTGWAQIHGRNALSFKARFAYDLWYVEHRSFGLDLRILARTLGQVVGGRGVYADSETTSLPYDGHN
jgi:lipopolysaccharide/colanic/teichoic acid biosynthesis glycosyltransferase